MLRGTSNLIRSLALKSDWPVAFVIWTTVPDHRPLIGPGNRHPQEPLPSTCIGRWGALHAHMTGHDRPPSRHDWQSGCVVCRTLDLPGLVTSRGGKLRRSLSTERPSWCAYASMELGTSMVYTPSSLLVKSRQGSLVIDVLTFSHFPSHNPQSSLSVLPTSGGRIKNGPLKTEVRI